ncbi:D-aminoacyl-tRNA deacylase [Aquimarina sp. ERC-38]|uniref:D-aminoacyl-tRNA deacylase n=1 Tax=Aquimarina sp. ERC-38 TaxID=2949996 RepID=UPI0022480CC7|nr:D-aminoacyl-tRNA deacylase [Aquimarina sp. ERC-38]UZO82485.1 D-aminoacyl-tRNA deacylase [Aquimarina sp. ERC-38]
MRAVIQRVQQASVTVEDKKVATIGKGLVILLGVTHEDQEEDISWLSQKIINLRIFNDIEGKMNKNIKDVEGDVIIVSQFTLFASTKKGNRPSYLNAAKPNIAKDIYLNFIEVFKSMLRKDVGTGIFGADMKVSLINDGPVTIIIDTENKE